MKFLEMLFEDLEKDPLFKNLVSSCEYPWDCIKNLKSFLKDNLPKKLPSNFPLNEPVPQSLLLVENEELIPLSELEVTEEGFFFKGKKVNGAIIYAGSFFTDRELYFENGVVVEPFAYVSGPGYFSEKSSIRHGAYVRGSVYAGKGAVIGHTTEVKNSIFLSEAKAAHFAYVGDSLLGKNVNLGAGTKLANLKFLKKVITFSIEGEVLHTGMRKLGAILGDNAQTGCNSVLQPGTVLGKGSFVFPGKTVGPGIFPPKSKFR
ncbi:MAG: glucose-1-phosphate thymidylyltransferase [Thermodesulfobacteria bacterium]|nr:glucose-1-phosphate thymidylyltransferase [Thermodesulfobacteriota bacterium]